MIRLKRLRIPRAGVPSLAMPPTTASTPFLSLLALVLLAASGSGAPSARLNNLTRASVEAGMVSYRQVAEAIYQDQTDAVIAAKRAWRVAMPETAWVSDYDLLLHVAVRVRVAPPPAADTVSPEAYARYAFETNTATIPTDFSGALLAHEVGHGLSRRSVRTTAAKQATDDRIAFEQNDPSRLLAQERAFDLRWLGYVTTQAEFEIRLQALNRFLYEMEGRVILTPGDALAALVGLGVEVDARDVRKALAFQDTEPPPGTVREIVHAPRYVRAARAEGFRNADDLRKAVQMAALWNPGLRSQLLAKIAREAPGHF